MGDITAETAIPASDTESREFRFAQSHVGITFLLKLAAASSLAIQRCLLEESAVTQVTAGAFAESSTEHREITPDVKAKLDAMLDAARQAIVEDGMNNPINERLPELVSRDFNAVIPALLSTIEAERTTPMVAAEILKELGRLRNATSHASRRWVLERALRSPWPFTRDGAGLGLARLGDSNAIPALRRAVDNEPNAQTRADLQLVIDELAEMMTDGTPAWEHY
jgi:HEAT repeat protein